MRNSKNRLILVSAAIFIFSAIASHAFAGSDSNGIDKRSCIQGSVRAKLANVEKARLIKEENRYIRPCMMIKLKAVKQELTTGDYATACKVKSFRDDLSDTELTVLAKEENKDLRYYELMKMRGDKRNLTASDKVSWHEDYVPGSVRANLSDSEKTALKREES